MSVPRAWSAVACLWIFSSSAEALPPADADGRVRPAAERRKESAPPAPRPGSPPPALPPGELKSKPPAEAPSPGGASGASRPAAASPDAGTSPPPPAKAPEPAEASNDDAAAKAAFDRGEVALAESRLEEAAAAYREALAVSASHVGAINGLGSVMYRLGQREEAIGYFRRALELDATFKLAHFNLGYAARKTGDFITAARAYERYTELEPGDPDGFYGLAESYRQLEQHEKALQAYEAYVLKEKRKSEQKWVERSREQISLLKQKLGIADPVDAGTMLASTSADGGVPLNAQVSGDGGVLAAAAADGGGIQVTTPVVIYSATPLAPSTAAATADGGAPLPILIRPLAPSTAPVVVGPAAERSAIDLADALVRERRLPDAIAQYEAVLTGNPANLEALFKAGTAYAIAGNYAQAIDRWRRASQLTPDPQLRRSAEDNIARASRKLQSANPALAAPVSTTAAGLRVISGGATAMPAGGVSASPSPPPTDAQVRAKAAYERGVQLIRARDFLNAHHAFTEALTLDPRKSAALTARGSANIGLRRFADAAADYESALRIDDRFASPLYGLAESLRAQGKLAEAKQFYERYATSTAPDARADLQAEARRKADAIR